MKFFIGFVPILIRTIFSGKSRILMNLTEFKWNFYFSSLAKKLHWQWVSRFFCVGSWSDTRSMRSCHCCHHFKRNLLDDRDSILIQCDFLNKIWNKSLSCGLPSGKKLPSQKQLRSLLCHMKSMLPLVRVGRFPHMQIDLNLTVCFICVSVPVKLLTMRLNYIFRIFKLLFQWR